MRLVVGMITKPHGIRGEVLIDVRTDEPSVRFAVGSVLYTDPTAMAPATRGRGCEALPLIPDTMEIVASRPHQGRYIVLFDGVRDRDCAETFRGVLLCIDRSEVGASDDPDEFHDYELIGLIAFDLQGERLGEIIRVDHAPASDVLVLQRPDGRVALVPFVKAIVVEVNCDKGTVTMDPPGGLFDL